MEIFYLIVVRNGISQNAIRRDRSTIAIKTPIKNPFKKSVSSFLITTIIRENIPNKMLEMNPEIIPRKILTRIFLLVP